MAFGKIKIRPVDSLFSKYVRQRDNWTCQYCGKYCGENNSIHKLEAAHYFGRRKESTRFDPENVHALCFTCHQRFHEDKSLHDEFMLRRLGEQGLAKLMLRANTAGRVDDKMTKLYINKLFEELNGN